MVRIVASQSAKQDPRLSNSLDSRYSKVQPGGRGLSLRVPRRRLALTLRRFAAHRKGVRIETVLGAQPLDAPLQPRLRRRLRLRSGLLCLQAEFPWRGPSVSSIG